jgi:drug/metabolite transporter (DMT)-like permease
MFAFPIALALGQDRFSIARVVGLGLGLGGVALLVGPEASLPDRAMVAFIPLALIAPFFTGLRAILSENLVRRALIQLRFCLAHRFLVRY